MTLELMEDKLLMADGFEKKLKKINDKHDAETKEIIKRLQDRKYWAFHVSTLASVLVGLLCGLWFQHSEDGYSVRLFFIFFACGFFAAGPKFMIERGKKASRVIQILLICFLLYVYFNQEDILVRSGLF